VNATSTSTLFTNLSDHAGMAGPLDRHSQSPRPRGPLFYLALFLAIAMVWVAAIFVARL
jgi:hypothetical protein